MWVKGVMSEVILKILLFLIMCCMVVVFLIWVSGLLFIMVRFVSIFGVIMFSGLLRNLFVNCVVVVRVL